LTQCSEKHTLSFSRSCGQRLTIGSGDISRKRDAFRKQTSKQANKINTPACGADVLSCRKHTVYLCTTELPHTITA